MLRSFTHSETKESYNQYFLPLSYLIMCCFSFTRQPYAVCHWLSSILLLNLSPPIILFKKKKKKLRTNTKRGIRTSWGLHTRRKQSLSNRTNIGMLTQRHILSIIAQKWESAKQSQGKEGMSALLFKDLFI